MSPHEAIYYLSGRSVQAIRVGDWKYRHAVDNTIYRTGRSGIDGVYSNKDIGYNDINEFGLLNTDLGANCVNGEFSGGFDDIRVGDFVGVRYYPDRQRAEILVPHTIRITKPLTFVSGR